MRLLSLGAGRDGERQQHWAQARPAVVLTVEPAPATPDVPFDAAVVLPGYLLPDDGHEESTHEEVDDALSRACTRRAPAGGGVPAPPRLPSRSNGTGAGALRRVPGHCAPRRSHGGGIARPHLPPPGPPAPAFPLAPAADGRTFVGQLDWPELVLTLERQWAERFERMADRLVEARDRQRLKVLLFTSCHRAEGRTTLVLSMARTLARRPGRTLLIDADLTGPMLSRSLGLRPEVGLEDVVEEGQAPGEALINVADEHLWILPLRAPVARPREFLASPGWSCLMARLRREFDLVLVDGSPMFTGLSAAALHRSVDAAVLVQNRGMTGERSLLRAREVLDGGGIPLLGLAETFV
ncbi:MAG: CpsD/CapB family tyrosine-protein kinase [Isosphaeraceae bacterium]